MEPMKELEAARREFALLVQAADVAFTMPQLAPSLLPAKLRDVADDVLRARSDDEFMDALDRALDMPEFLSGLLSLPKLERDHNGELMRLRHVLGDEAGEIAALGQRRLAGMADAFHRIAGRSLAEGQGVATVRVGARPDGTPVSRREIAVDVKTVMDAVYADLPVEWSAAILSLGRALVCWLAIVRADEGGRSVATCLCDQIAQTYAHGAYPALQLLASMVPVPEELVPTADIVNFADTVKAWLKNRAEVEAAGEAALTTGEPASGSQPDSERRRG